MIRQLSTQAAASNAYSFETLKVTTPHEYVLPRADTHTVGAAPHVCRLAPLLRKHSGGVGVEEKLSQPGAALQAPHEYVFHVELNRPEKRNAMNMALFK